MRDEHGQSIAQVWQSSTTTDERERVAAWTHWHDTNIGLQVHFGYFKERKTAGKPPSKRRSTPADNKRLYDLCMLIRAASGLKIDDIFEDFENQTYEDRNTFDSLVSILADPPHELLYVERYNPTPGNRRTKSLRLTEAGDTAVEVMWQIQRSSLQRQTLRGDFTARDARANAYEEYADDYRDITLTNEQFLNIVRGEARNRRIDDDRE